MTTSSNKNTFQLSTLISESHVRFQRTNYIVVYKKKKKKLHSGGEGGRLEVEKCVFYHYYLLFVIYDTSVPGHQIDNVGWVGWEVSVMFLL